MMATDQTCSKGDTMNKRTQQQHQTIAAVAVTMMKKYERDEADVVVAAVKKRFPKSLFNRDQFHYYHSLLSRGMVDSKGKRQLH